MGGADERVLWWAVLALLALSGGALAWWLTSAGMVLTPDSGSYVSTAQLLADGEGLRSGVPAETSRMTIAEQVAAEGRFPFSEWPPLYPAAVAVGILAGADPLDAARAVAVASLAVTAVLGAVLARRVTAASATARTGAAAAPVAVTVAVLVVVGPVLEAVEPLFSVTLAEQAAFVLSETMFVPLFLAAVIVGSAATPGARRAVLVAGVVLVVAATATRYLGLAAAVGAGVAVHREGAKRAGVTLVASGAAVTLGWPLAQVALWGGSSGEAFAWHPPGAERLSDLLDLVGAWFLIPPSWPVPLRVLLVLAAVGVPTVVALRRSSARPSSSLRAALIVTWWAYLAMLLVTMSVLDANVPVAQRTLAPLQPVLYLSLVAAVPARRSAVVAVGALAAALAVPSILRLPAGRDALAEAATTTTRADATAAARLGDEAVIVTNLPSRAWFGTGASVLLLPDPVVVVTGEPNPDHHAELAAVGRLLRERGGAVVLYPDLRISGTTPRELHEHAGLVRLEACGDDPAVYVLPEDAASYRDC